MNFRNFRGGQSSQDDAFLQNFNIMQESSDMLDHLCKGENMGEQKMEGFQKQYKEEYIQQEGLQSSMKNERKRSGQSKEKKKIFYRDKMAELMKSDEYVKQEYNYVAYNQFEHNKTPISKDEQLKRNRESAKNSRQRKKQYITILEKKNQENLKLIDDLKSQLDQVKLERDRLKEDNHQQINNFLKSKAMAYQNLNRILGDPKSSGEQIKTQINLMLQRFSASGCQRIAVMNYYMNQITEGLLSDIHKYFLTSSVFKHGLSPSNPPKGIDLDVMKILDVDITKMSQLTNKYKDRFAKQAQVFKTLTQQFYRVFKSIESQSKVVELIFVDLVKEIDSRKVGQLIIWFEDNKFCRQLRKVRKQWTSLLTTGQQVIEVIRKQMKKN